MFLRRSSATTDGRREGPVLEFTRRGGRTFLENLATIGPTKRILRVMTSFRNSLGAFSPSHASNYVQTPSNLSATVVSVFQLGSPDIEQSEGKPTRTSTVKIVRRTVSTPPTLTSDVVSACVTNVSAIKMTLLREEAFVHRGDRGEARIVTKNGDAGRAPCRGQIEIETRGSSAALVFTIVQMNLIDEHRAHMDHSCNADSRYAIVAVHRKKH